MGFPQTNEDRDEDREGLRLVENDWHNYDDLSIEEIRNRADEEIRQRMQRIGEEGGW